MDPLLKKLRYRPELRICILDATAPFKTLVAEAASVRPESRLRGKFGLVHAFFSELAKLRACAAKLREALDEGGILWVSYPKAKALGTDLNRDIIRETLAPAGLEAVAIVSMDETWSALRCKAVPVGKERSARPMAKARSRT